MAFKGGKTFNRDVSIYNGALYLNGVKETINGQDVYVDERDRDGNVSRAHGTATITDGASGYVKGCLYRDTDVTAGTTGIYENVGTTTSCNFDTIGSAGSATAYNAIGDPTASGSIGFGAYTGTYTSSTANWGGILMENSHSNPTAGANILSLKYTADGDAHGIFMSCIDHAGADTKFQIAADGATTIAGTATGTAALTLTAGDILVSDGGLTLTTGTITLTAGGLDVDSDNVNITLGDSGATDSKIYFDGAGNLTFYDSTAGTATLNQLINASPTGDFTISNGQFSRTDSIAEQAGTRTFAGTSTTDIAWSSAVSTGKCLSITANGLTSGDMVYLSNTVAGLTTGNYIHCYDGAASDFTVAINGLTTIAGTASGTDALVLNAGDILVTSGHIDMTVGDLTLADGSVTITDADNAATVDVTNNTITTADMVVIDSTSITTGALVKLNSNTATADGEVLEIISAGDATSTPVGCSITIANPTTGAARGLEITMAAATTTAKGIAVTMDALTEGHMLYLDNGGGTLTTGTYINCNDDGAVDFSVSNYGATVITGTAAGTASLTLTTGDLVISDTDTTTITSVDGTGSIVEIISGGAIGADKACLEIDAAGEFNATGTLLRLSAENITATNAPYAMHIDCAALNMSAIKIETAPTTNSGFLATTTGVLAADKAVMELVSNADACNADSAVLRLEQTHATGANGCLILKQDDVDVPFITFETTIGAGNSIQAVGALALTATHYIAVDIEGVGTRYFTVGTVA